MKHAYNYILHDVPLLEIGILLGIRVRRGTPSCRRRLRTPDRIASSTACCADQQINMTSIFLKSKKNSRLYFVGRSSGIYAAKASDIRHPILQALMMTVSVVKLQCCPLRRMKYTDKVDAVRDRRLNKRSTI